MLAAESASHNTPTAPDQWTQLDFCCAHCINLAQQISSQLKRGVSGQDLMPLLEESAAHVRQLQTGIQNLHKVDRTDADRAGHRALLEQMRTLLQLEEQNRSLLSSKGIPLNRPRPYRYQPRRTPQS